MGENQRVRSARKFRRVCDVKNWVFPFGFCVRRDSIIKSDTVQEK